MTEYVRTIPLGAATVTAINLGDLNFRLAEVINVPESEWRPRYGAAFEELLLFPSQSFHIALPNASIVVDVNDYAASTSLDSPYVPPNYQPPPGMLARLDEMGIRPEDITHLIITHAHFDHYAGITTKRDGRYVPTFPNARCYLGRPDWEDPETQEALKATDSFDGRTFGVIQQAGLLELVEGNRDLLPEVRIIAAPGESPGHQIVRIHSQGQTLYCVGDLFHHSVEVEHPEWMARWADKETTIASRRALAEAALAENALIAPAHMPLGRLQRTDAGITWVAV